MNNHDRNFVLISVLGLNETLSIRKQDILSTITKSLNCMDSVQSTLHHSQAHRIKKRCK